MTTKTMFIPKVGEINAYKFPQRKGSETRIALHSENWNQLESFFTAKYPGEIRNFEVSFDLKLAYYPNCKQTFILSIDTSKETIRVSNEMYAGAWGQFIFADFTHASSHIAEEFCKLNKLRIVNEVGHWPILQYVVEVI